MGVLRHSSFGVRPGSCWQQGVVARMAWVLSELQVFVCDQRMRSFIHSLISFASAFAVRKARTYADSLFHVQMTGVDDVLNMAYRSVGWALVPQFLAKHVLSLTYKTGLCGPMPRQGTPQYQRAFRMTYAGVILVYLIGNIAYVVWSQDPNFYRLLNVNSTAEDAQVKTAFRRFAVRNHPDKVGEQGQELFMRVRHAYEALIVPAKKFAYER